MSEDYAWKKIQAGVIFPTNGWTDEQSKVIAEAFHKAEGRMIENLNREIFSDTDETIYYPEPLTFKQNFTIWCKKIYYDIKFRLTVLFTGKCPECEDRDEYY